jgi:hypothetical protein
MNRCGVLNTFGPFQTDTLKAEEIVVRKSDNHLLRVPVGNISSRVKVTELGLRLR